MIKRMYLVGGAVRDQLLDREPKDFDYVVTGFTVDEMKEMYGEPIGVDFPVWLDEDNNEIAMARTERSTGNGYNDFQVDIENVTIEQDLCRRDLTINSIAQEVDLSTKQPITTSLVDPYDGVHDILTRTLRNTSGAFIEDPLRVLRLARFSARYPDFNISPHTLELARMIDLSSLQKERVWAETEKALYETSPDKYFTTLKDIGYLSYYRPKGGFVLRQRKEVVPFETATRWTIVTGNFNKEMSEKFNPTQLCTFIASQSSTLNIVRHNMVTLAKFLVSMGVNHEHNQPFITAMSRAIDCDWISDLAIDAREEFRRCVRVPELLNGPAIRRSLDEQRTEAIINICKEKYSEKTIYPRKIG